jgi:hypothetical protein
MQYATETLSRNEAIDWLIADDIATIKQASYNDDYAYLSDILIHGKGYGMWTITELNAEIYERSE